jgi:hypothetical protein
MTSRISKVDLNQKQVMCELRTFGCAVQPIHTVGHGCPDLLVSFGGRTFVVEVKSKGGKLTPDEQKWHDNWKAKVCIAYATEDVIKFIDEFIGE